MSVESLDKLSYVLSGALRRLKSRKRCPACGSTSTSRIDRKLFHTLEHCNGCSLLFRFPYESAEETNRYYQTSYRQLGLTTELPDDTTLSDLMASSFKDSHMDFSRVIRLLSVLKVGPGSTILDYGANWGYAAYQFRDAGYDVTAYEMAIQRAAFGQRLGIKIETDLSRVSGNFDVVYSSHVLEHVPNPSLGLQEQFNNVRPGGFLIGHTPNGSLDRRRADLAGFRHHWGRVHPVLLSEQFIRAQFRQYPLLVTSLRGSDVAVTWNDKEQMIGKMCGPELLFIIRKQPIVSGDN